MSLLSLLITVWASAGANKERLQVDFLFLPDRTFQVAIYGDFERLSKIRDRGILVHFYESTYSERFPAALGNGYLYISGGIPKDATRFAFPKYIQQHLTEVPHLPKSFSDLPPETAQNSVPKSRTPLADKAIRMPIRLPGAVTGFVLPALSFGLFIAGILASFWRFVRIERVSWKFHCLQLVGCGILALAPFWVVLKFLYGWTVVEYDAEMGFYSSLWFAAMFIVRLVASLIGLVVGAVVLWCSVILLDYLSPVIGSASIWYLFRAIILGDSVPTLTAPQNVEIFCDNPFVVFCKFAFG